MSDHSKVEHQDLDVTVRNRSVEYFLWAVLAGTLALVLVSGVWWRVQQPTASATNDLGPRTLPRLGEVPDFFLIERSGAVVTRDQLKSNPWVADFIFSSCAGVCPVLSERMSRLRRAIDQLGLDHVRFVSFSVDPTRDTPEVLRDYARRYGADDHSWWFVTGERDALYDLIGKGFRLAVADRSGTGDAVNDLITHSDRFVLVDSEGQIRGYYRGTEQEGSLQLVRDLLTLELERAEPQGG